jgi:NitT/TauT family transport system permease protein
MTELVRTVAVTRIPWHALSVIAALLIAWQLAFLAVGNDALSSPLATFGAAWDMISSAAFIPDLQETGVAFAAAYAAAVILGVGFGLVLGSHRLSGDVAEPMIAAFYAIPKLTLYPIILLMVGIGMPARIVFGALHGIVPITLITMSAVREVKPVLLKTGHVMRLSRLSIICHILVPVTIPEIFSGLRIGFSVTLLGTLLGEMFGSQRGVGFLLMNAIGLAQVQTIMSLTLLLTVFAVGANAILLAVDRRLHRTIG